MKSTNNANPLNEYINKLFEHINKLQGFLFILDDQLNNFRKLLNYNIEHDKLDISKLISGSSVVLRDLTEWPANGAAIYYPSGKFILQGQEYLDMIDNLISRESAWTISQAYEVFETYLKDISAIYIFLHPLYQEKIRFHVNKFNLTRSRKIPVEDFVYWRNYIQYRYKNNVEILKFLRIINPDIEKAEKYNNRHIDFTQWFDVVSVVRHAITHSSSKIKKDIFGKLTSYKLQLLSNMFNGTFEQNDYVLFIRTSDAKECLTFFAEYAFALYKQLSELDNYDWYDVLLEKRS